MMDGTQPLLAMLVVLAMAATAGGQVRDAEAIRDEYRSTWARLVATRVQPWTTSAVEQSNDFRRAWELTGEWLVAVLRQPGAATATDVRSALVALNPEDVMAACKSAGEPDEIGDEFFCRIERFSLDGDVLTLGPGPRSVFAVAARSSYFGRLLLVSPEGLLASEPIGRCAALRSLPATTSGDARFFAFSHCDDWPTSCCGGGTLGIWRWDGRRLHGLVARSFGVPRPGCGDDPRLDRVLYERGRWLKLYTRGGRIFSTSCSGSELKRLWKIRIDPDGVRDLGSRMVVPELDLADRLIHRVALGAPAIKLAAPDVTERLGAMLRGGETCDPSGRCRTRYRTVRYSILGRWRVTRAAGTSSLLLQLDDPLNLVFTFAERRGRPYVVSIDTAPCEDRAGPWGIVDARQPPLTGGNTATSSPSASR